MRMLANEQHFRRTTCPTTNTYAMSGLRQSAKAFLLLAGLHPTLATGFHHLATARHGTFQTWQQVRKQHTRNPTKYQIGSTMAAEGCPCCNNANVARSATSSLNATTSSSSKFVRTSASRNSRPSLQPKSPDSSRTAPTTAPAQPLQHQLTANLAQPHTSGVEPE